MRRKWTGLSGRLSDTDLRLLRVFLIVVEQEGLAASEVALDKSVSAISLDISKLEKRLGATLCRRGKGGFALTEEGRIVYNAALQLFTDIDRFRDRIGSAARSMAGRITLALIDNLVTVAEAPLVRALGEFRRDWPNVVPVLESASAQGVVQAVLRGTAEIGISVLPRTVESLDTIPLFRETLLLYCGPGHPLFGRAAEAGLEEVQSHRLIWPSVRDDPAFDEVLSRFPPGARSDNLDGRALLLLSGGDLGFLPPDFAAPWVARGALRAVRPDAIFTENTFRLVTRRSGERSTAAEAMMTELLGAFRAADRDVLSV
ncbi:LysR family transcriptional regulator [Paroceanicella profunda]|uniref:LysR family transcriptional regulator n=1 Tax=Paroceanicella profunda TaxID=2579971 RepID=A0A5B8FZL0_9RHOB|nr:LysR family transcriptional regulator [Paroceanicella profunda]QDL91703.1 LysR family transcriptional regulator [Paroceanicella profunda]